MTVSSVNNGWATGSAVEFVHNSGSFSIHSAINTIASAPITLFVFAKTYPQRSLQVKIKKTTEFFDREVKMRDLIEEELQDLSAGQ